jgi:phenylalanyl-tRNA synthetase beta chain
MKISLNWLKEFIKIPKNSIKIESILTETGLEVDDIIKINPDIKSLENLVVGEVISITNHKNADKLKVTRINIDSEELSIICGAKNIKISQKVVVAKIGTEITHINGEKIKIKKSKIRGINSHGMICAEDEIGIGQSHSGIIILNKNAKNGEKANKYFDLYEDTIFEISLTPNRADAASHLGVARDIKAVLKSSINMPDVSHFKSKKKFSIKIDVIDNEACPRYSGCIIDNVKVGESPSFIKKYLTSIGLTPINNIVDITNYILHGIGQPMHAFDYDKIKSKNIQVKFAKKGNIFKTLDGVERKLHNTDLMICDKDRPLCIAGVSGGESSGITTNTKRIFLESAYFSPANVRKSSLNHQLKTDASYRFERGTDPSLTVYALKLASLLINKHCSGEISSEIIDVYKNKIKNKTFSVNLNRINSLIGQKIDKSKIFKILNSLDIKTKEKGKNILISVPPYRTDVTREADIVEEILRIYGYNKIKISSNIRSKFLSNERPSSLENSYLLSIISLLVNNGFNEITTNSLTSSRYRDNKFWNDDYTIEMINKLSDEHAILKQSLLFTGLESIKYNLNRKQNNLKFFEFDKTYNRVDNKIKETKKIGIYMTGLYQDEHFDVKSKQVSFFELFNTINKIMIQSNIIYDSIATKSKILDDCINITINKKTLATIGKVKKELLSSFEINQDLYYAELEWENYTNNLNHNLKYKSISKYPEVKRDLSIILDDKKNYSDILMIINKSNKVIKKTSLYNVYEGNNIGNNKKAYALRFVLQDENKTLDDKTINNIMNNLIEDFEIKLKAEIRK